MVVSVPLLLAAGWFALFMATLIHHIVSRKTWGKQLEDARTEGRWWRDRALTPAPVRPPPLPQEPFWSRAATVMRDSP